MSQHNRSEDAKQALNGANARSKPPGRGQPAWMPWNVRLSSKHICGKPSQHNRFEG